MRLLARGVALVASLAFARPLSATTVVPVTFDELVVGAREIFVGRVVAKESHWLDTRDGRVIVTMVTLVVDESLKGGLQTQTSLEFLGGTVGDVTFEVVGLPAFRVGDRELLFVGDRGALSPIVGFMQGRFRVVPDPVTGVASVRSNDGRAVESTADIGTSRPQSLRPVQSLTLGEFRAAILARLRTAGGVR